MQVFQRGELGHLLKQKRRTVILRAVLLVFLPVAPTQRKIKIKAAALAGFRMVCPCAYYNPNPSRCSIWNQRAPSGTRAGKNDSAIAQIYLVFEFHVIVHERPDDRNADASSQKWFALQPILLRASTNSLCGRCHGSRAGAWQRSGNLAFKCLGTQSLVERKRSSAE